MAVRAIRCLVHVKYFVIIDPNIVTVSCKDYFFIYTLFWLIALPVLTLVLAALSVPHTMTTVIRSHWKTPIPWSSST